MKDTSKIAPFSDFGLLGQRYVGIKLLASDSFGTSLASN
jgi:hypothetical protein